MKPIKLNISVLLVSVLNKLNGYALIVFWNKFTITDKKNPIKAIL